MQSARSRPSVRRKPAAGKSRLRLRRYSALSLEFRSPGLGRKFQASGIERRNLATCSQHVRSWRIDAFVRKSLHAVSGRYDAGAKNGPYTILYLLFHLRNSRKHCQRSVAPGDSEHRCLRSHHGGVGHLDRYIIYREGKEPESKEQSDQNGAFYCGIQLAHGFVNGRRRQRCPLGRADLRIVFRSFVRHFPWIAGASTKSHCQKAWRAFTRVCCDIPISRSKVSEERTG